jgi:hypothetical protein
MKAKLLCIVLAAGFLALLNLNCDDDVNKPTNTTPDPIPDCQKNNTSKVFFINKSTTGKSYDVVWDGSVFYTLAPNEQSDTMTVAAQIAHSLIFKVAGTNTAACSESSPILTQCGLHWYWCDN